MNISPLQLKHSWIERLDFQCASFGEDVSDTSDVSVEVDYGQHPSNPQEWMVGLTTVISNSNEEEVAKYLATVKFVGLFRVDAELEREKQLKIVAVNAPSVLFSATREVLVQITARSPLGPIELPTLSFLGHNLTEPDAPAEAREGGVESQGKA